MNDQIEVTKKTVGIDFNKLYSELNLTKKILSYRYFYFRKCKIIIFAL